MRGRDDRSGGLFSYVRLEERVPADHPLRPIRALADEALAALNGRFEGLYSSMGRPSIPPEMLLGDAAAGLLLGALRADADGADQLQPVVPLVCRPAAGWRGVACDGVHAQPRPAARGRGGAGVPFGAVVAAAGQDAALGRALLGRRHADRRLGLDEEL